MKISNRDNSRQANSNDEVDEINCPTISKITRSQDHFSA